MRLSQLATSSNLQLAWRRITTGGNHQYKRFFRELYWAYEISLAENLEDLRKRLIGGAFKPQKPDRVYLPKNSGLHRPLSLLRVEDQIVLQAFANLAASRLHRRRAPLQFKAVFSNILASNRSIFFFRRWQDTYAAFQRQIRKNYRRGFRWVADFDLAAFYDTVSHQLLLKTIYPRDRGGNDTEWLLKCMRTWSSEESSSNHSHGIPQGPLASDFLAECFLLPIDLMLRNEVGYIRYVDDVRLFGRTEDSVRAQVIKLEWRCRERGLIPQSGKFSIKEAKNIDEALGMLPSIGDPHGDDGDTLPPLGRSDARSLLKTSLGGKPYRVRDKTRLRFVLFRAEPDPQILRLVVSLVPRHPEHADAFFHYLGLFDFRKSILRLCLDLIRKNPYRYVRGEAWHVLAGYLAEQGTLDARVRRRLTTLAVEIAKKRKTESIAEKWGAGHFLAVSEAVTGSRHSRFLRFQPPLLQALLAPVLPLPTYGPGELVQTYLRSPYPEPGMSICGQFHAFGLTLGAFGLVASDLPSQVRNTLVALGTIPTAGGPIDPIAEILKTRYKVSSSKSWHTLLGIEYAHALGLLRQAEAAFSADMSHWLQLQNSFHHAIFIGLQKHLAATGHPGKCTTVDKHGALVEFGVMLDPKGPFSKNCAAVADCFRTMNARRNHLPASHPYEKKTAKQTRYLKANDRDGFVSDLRNAYPAFLALMP